MLAAGPEQLQGLTLGVPGWSQLWWGRQDGLCLGGFCPAVVAQLPWGRDAALPRGGHRPTSSWLAQRDHQTPGDGVSLVYLPLPSRVWLRPQHLTVCPRAFPGTVRGPQQWEAKLGCPVPSRGQ